MSIALNETDDPATPPISPEEEGGNEFVTLIEKIDKYASDFPDLRRTMLNNLRHLASFDDRVGDSFDIYANVRTVRFNEMEYSVPAEHGPACLREILKLIQDKDLRTWFPIEYRYVKADHIPLSMFEGRDSFDLGAQLTDGHHNRSPPSNELLEYNGPHWGKLTRQRENLQPLYPRWREFAEVREALDPSGRFLNAHLSSILGVS